MSNWQRKGQIPLPTWKNCLLGRSGSDFTLSLANKELQLGVRLHWPKWAPPSFLTHHYPIPGACTHTTPTVLMWDLQLITNTHVPKRMSDRLLYLGIFSAYWISDAILITLLRFDSLFQRKGCREYGYRGYTAVVYSKLIFSKPVMCIGSCKFIKLNFSTRTLFAFLELFQCVNYSIWVVLVLLYYWS